MDNDEPMWDYDWLQHTHRFTRRNPLIALIPIIPALLMMIHGIELDLPKGSDRLLVDAAFVIAVEILDRIFWESFVWAMRFLGVREPSCPPTTMRTFAAIFCVFFRLETLDRAVADLGPLLGHAVTASGCWFGIEAVLVARSSIQMFFKWLRHVDQQMVDQGRYDWLIRRMFG